MNKYLKPVGPLVVIVLLVGGFIWFMTAGKLTSSEIQARDGRIRSMMDRFMNYEPIAVNETELGQVTWLDRDSIRTFLEQQCLIKGTNSLRGEEMDEFLLNSEFLIIRRHPKLNQ